MRHPLDPAPAHAAAAFLGHLAAAGLTDAAEAGRVDRCGLASRLAHAFADSRSHWARRRHLAAERIRARLAPLLDAGAARGTIIRVAEAAADESLRGVRAGRGARRHAAAAPLMEEDAVWSAWERRRGSLSTAPLAPSPAALPDPATIPPRAWLYGTRLIRGFVSVLAAPGGVGKSALALGIAVALATGRPILGERVHHSVPVWVLNLEDPLDELNRRVAALLRLHGVPDEAVAGRLYLNSGRTRRLTMAAADAGAEIEHPDRDSLITAARAAAVGCLVVDPFVKSHRLDEYSNMHMDAAATAWAEVADAAGAAVLLVHHVRKAGAAAGPAADVDITRGAKSLTDAARAAFLLSVMTAEEAQNLSVPERDRWRHVRLDDAKANLAPRAETARWFRLESVALGNGTEAYPHGDTVAAVMAWKPPSPFRALGAADCNRALDLIAAGPGAGAAYAAWRRGRSGERWAGRVLAREFGLDDGDAARVIAAWMRSGVLEEAPYHDGQQRKARLGVRVVDARRPTDATHGSSPDVSRGPGASLNLNNEGNKS